ncbi:MAG: endopeptidase La [Deltaproteobacteria bacterium]|nr:endopeptidase La [Deltaproteobacteria bacterium]MCW5802741.1 endopeptidase La [Deltaproteobacteria bacterium]
MTKHTETAGQYPVIPLRTEVQLPGHVGPLEIGREASVRAIEAATRDDNLIVIIPQKNPAVRDPGQRDLHEVGVRAEIVQVVKHSPGRFTCVMRFLERVHIDALVATEPFLVASVSSLAATSSSTAEQLIATTAKVRDYLLAVVTDAQAKEAKEPAAGQKSEGKEPPRGELTRAQVQAIVDPDKLVDAAAPYLELERDDLTALLVETDTMKRLERIIPSLERQATVLRLKADIGAELEGESSRTHRERVLRDRMRQIQEELGEQDDNAEIDELRKKIEDSKMSDEVRAVAKKQLSRMSQMASSSPEYNIARTYVENLLEIPWNVFTDDRLDVGAARAILDAEHSGLEKVKRRILEFLAVRKLAPNKHGPILLFVGPPGVGKTSLGRSIASSLGRKYVRISLGGVRDEAEVRGHRRTYIGALPGRIVAGLKKAGSMNPVFVLDEIDKLAADMRGDPAAAMLEVLDPEQNKDFVDHYVEVPVDLSKVMFICTANQTETISQPLLDRMEMVELSGYTTVEKLAIAKNHLVPKQLGEHGITREQLELDDDAVADVIHSYTREAGVRNLEREIAAVCRGAAVKVAEGSEKIHIQKPQLEELLGPPRYVSDTAERSPEVGVITGLAWTPVGGDIMFIETRIYPGKGEVRLTGQMGDVMKESAQAAVTWTRANSARLGVDTDKIAASDLHIHLPQGAIKKDGPSAGVALAVAVVSVFTKRPIRNDVAITGEIDLRGNALPVGGIKEKVLAAHRAGIKIVFLPARNEKDTIDIPDEVKNAIELRFMTKIDDALSVALGEAPTTPEPEPAIPPPTAPSRGSVGERLPS